MRSTPFPRSGEPISKLGFGTMGFAGWFGDHEESDWIDSLLYALDRGVSFIDTARAYGNSERIVGKALRQWSGQRPYVATKIESLAGPRGWGTPVAPEDAYPPGHVRAGALRSLTELALDHVDLVQLHIWWPTWGVTGYWMDELRQLKEDGLVRHIGVSIPDHRCDMALPLVESGLIDSVQSIINIFDPLALDNLLPACQRHDVAVVARCVLDEGGLTGTLTEDTAFDEDDYRHRYFDDIVPRSVYLKKVDALRQYVPAYAGSLAALALKFVIQSPGVTTAISSMHVRAYCEENIAALEEPALPAEVFDRLRFKHRFIKNFNETKIFAE
ncbi:aldo/keto reductase [Streptomyces iranensis]|uniref:Aldo/keto reductase n=1 Tax=Streptomyces iranensis TaxID=576784 RepID=A0A060ZAZ1_9ACTN|nr:aldo/keto reductase [Streptomyces iranensis]MBP2068502.1 aryl-alcohol dehydrogenase-like predicted oxidoreductase [Streptomyces iranensis]CDR01211.1 aldo/keto reductase [Streptomyces iranensis]